MKAGLEASGFLAANLRIAEGLGEAIEWYQLNLNQGDTVLFLNDLPDTY